MNKQKHLWNLLGFITVVIMGAGFVSCNGHDDEGSDVLVGSWSCSNRCANLDTTDFATDTFTFKSDGTYEWKCPTWNNDSGNYYYNEESSTLTIINKKGTIWVYVVVSITDASLIIIDEDGWRYTYRKSTKEGKANQDEVRNGNVNNGTQSGNQESSVDVQKIVNENVTANVQYKYYTFCMELYTDLTAPGKYFTGRSDIKYGVEWYYTSGNGSSGSYTLDPNNKFMSVTVVSSNHYSVIIPVFIWEDDLDKTTSLNMLSFEYRYLKQKEEEGKTSSSDEKAAMKKIENYLYPYTNVANAYRGKVYVEISGKRYYVSSFQK